MLLFVLFRLGQALSQLNQTQEAIDAYEQALKLTTNDPSMVNTLIACNTNCGGLHVQKVWDWCIVAWLFVFQSSTISEQLSLARSKLSGSSSNSAAASPFAGGLGNLDFASLLNNPMVQDLAKNLDFSSLAGAGGAGGLDFNAMLNNPAVQNFMSNMNAGAADSTTSDDTTTSSSTPAAESVPEPGSNSTSSSTSSDPLESFLASPAGQSIKSDPVLAPVIEDVRANGQGALFK